jgi:hypothetical protein
MDDVERRGRELEADSRAMERKRISEAREREHQRTMDFTRNRMERDAQLHRTTMMLPFVMFVVTLAAFIVGRLISNYLRGV